MGRNWTDEQREAIYAPAGKYNILVSADAGSGKTSVLVERICNMIINHNVSIEKLLVVTFTNAAAATMKEKIIERLQGAVYECTDIEKRRILKEQTYLCATADILTIDAFCLNVLKNNFHLAGIAPNFYIIDKTEDELLKAKALEDIFDELYTSEDKNDKYKLNKLISAFADNRSDDKLLSVIMSVYEFAQSFAKPMEWIEGACSCYDENGKKVWLNELYLPFVYKKNISSVLSALKKGRDFMPITGEEFGADTASSNTAKTAVEKFNMLMVYAKNVVSYAEKLLMCNNIDEVIKVNSDSQIGTLEKKYVGISKTPALSAEYDAVSGAVKSIIEKINEFPFKSCEEMDDVLHIRELNDVATSLVWIIQKYHNSLSKLKEKRSVWSFSDIEHKVYDLFCDTQNGLCKKYSEKYTEILIDEYQDTNGLQDSIFRSISKNNRNIFMVGDLKQSIYLFRGGDPYIFKKKFNEYTQNVNDENENDISGRLIKLSKNFRSSNEVLKSVDALFSQVMTDEVGDIKYVCNSYDDNTTNDEIKTKLYNVAYIKDTYEDEDEIVSRAEAQRMACEIKNLIGKTIKKGDRTKTIGYGDITILLRAIKGKAQVYTEEFKKAGVPLRVVLSDFFEKREVQVMTSLLSVISNFKQDIAMVSVLLSPIFSFSANELAQIKCIYRDNRKDKFHISFFDMLCFVADNCTDEEISQKCKKTVQTLRKWREYTRIMPVAKLIWTIYEESGFYDFLGAIDGNEESQKNLRLLYQRAQSFEHGGSKGLFNFVNYMENLKNNGDGLSGAKSVSPDTVSVMTIHASKGLEFPVVFLGGLGQKFKNSNSDSIVKVHGDYGIGIPYGDVDEQVYDKNIFTNVISGVRKREELSELVRLLYVAMTRAEYMIVNFYSFKVSDEEKAYNTMDTHKYKELTDESNSHAQNFAAWMLPVALNSDEFECGDVEFYEETEPVQEEQHDTSAQLSKEGIDAVKKLLDYKYKYTQSTDIPSRTSATELKKTESIRRKAQITIRKKPRFLSNEIDGALRGIAYHNAMAFIDLESLRANLCIKTVQDELKRLADEGKINKDIYIKDTKMAENIYTFFKSKLGADMLSANTVYREKDFQTSIDASYYKENSKVEKGETMILQGVIDCFFENKDGDVILLDFKTDNMSKKTKQDMLNLYGLQLNLYAEAIEKITSKKVAYKYLYLFDTGEEVQYKTYERMNNNE